LKKEVGRTILKSPLALLMKFKVHITPII